MEERPPELERPCLMERTALLFAPQGRQRWENPVSDADLDGAESNPPSLFGEQMGCGHRHTLDALQREPGWRRRSGLRSRMNHGRNELLRVGVLKTYTSFHSDPRGDKPGGDNGVEPSRREESKETQVGGWSFSHHPLQTGFQEVSDCPRESRDKPE